MEKISTSPEAQDLKRLSLLSMLVLILLVLLNTSCYEQCEKYTYVNYEAVYRPMDSLRNEVDIVDPQIIETPGALFYKDGIVYVNEVGKGIHVIDDRDPYLPKDLVFLDIPGNYSVAAKGNYLYADNFTDLLVFDISNPEQIQLVDRIENVFTDFSAMGFQYDASREAMIEYVAVPVEDMICDDTRNWGYMYGNRGNLMMMSESASGMDASGGSDTGESGSMARFIVTGDVLYTIDHYKMTLFNVAQPHSPTKDGDVEIGWGIETIFPYKDLLFIGGMDGMYIMDNTNKLAPTLLSTYSHVTSCDPVVVQNDLAYVTLRNGTECQGYTNQLEIVDVSNPQQPTLLKTYEMFNPHGLAIQQNCLYICEGSQGLKSFQINSTDPTQITQKAFYEGFNAFDVIALDDLLLVVGTDGFYQYSAGCGSEFQYISTIGF